MRDVAAKHVVPADDDLGRSQATAAAWSVGAAMLTATFNNVRQGFLLLDDLLQVRCFNRRLRELIGFPPGVLLEGATAFSLISASVALGHYPGSTIDEAYSLWTQRLKNRVPGRHRSLSSDGRTLKIGCMPFAEGDWIINYEDISARVNAEDELREQSERLQAVLRNIPVGVAMFDRDRRLMLCGAEYARLYALPPELTVAGTPIGRIFDHRALMGSLPVDMKAYFDFINEAETTGTARTAHVALQDGRTIRMAHSGGFVGTHEDVTEAVKAEQRIQFLGSHDALTGMPNRAALRERIDEALVRARRGEMFGLLYLDPDNFKPVNDAFGHLIGDLLLKQVAARLRARLREIDTPARIGGDEFVVLQANLDTPRHAGDLARRLVEALVEPFDLDGRQAFIGVSFGVSVCPYEGADAEILLKNADMAMYRAKSEGRNTYRFFESAMNARIQARRLVEFDLRRAMANEEFELHYQPQIDARTETITG